jgi:hypothetical protein
MAGKNGSFWIGVAIGFVVMVLLNSLPVIGPLIGGFIAGIIARGGMWNGAKAGFLAGIFGAVIISVILIIGGSLLLGVPGFITALGVSFIIVLAALYFGIIGLIGGLVAGALVK